MDTLGLLEEPIKVPFLRPKPYNLIIPSLSALATLVAVLNCLITRAYSDSLQKMVLMINLADLLYCVTYLSVPIISLQSDIYCGFSYVAYNFGVLSSMMWAAMFGHALYTCLKTRNIDQIGSNLKFYMVFAVLLPFLFTLCVAIFANFVVFDNGLHRCVHMYNGKKDYQTIFLVVLPGGLSILLNLVYYALAIKRLRGLTDKEDQKGVSILVIYPLILLVCYAPYGLGYLFRLIWPEISDQAIVDLFNISQLQGFFDAIVYGGGIKNLYRKFRQIICICSQKESAEKSNKETMIIIENSSSVILSHDESFRERRETILN